VSAKHTPAPWRISEQSPTIIKQNLRLAGIDGGVLIGSASGHPNSGFFPSDEEALANARRIVQCVNAHDELVATLQAVNVSAVLIPGTDGREASIDRATLDKVLAVIAKVTGSTS
jgi:hypothetical protein